jgi:hypothetical protein
MHQHSQISRPRPQQRHGRLKRLRLAMTRIPRPAPQPAPTPVSPTTSSPTAAPTAITTRLGNLFHRRSDRAGPRVVDVAYAQGRLRNAAAGAPGSSHSLIRDEDYHGPPTPDPNLQQQQQAAAVQVDTGEHGGGRSCCCC